MILSRCFYAGGDVLVVHLLGHGQQACRGLGRWLEAVGLRGPAAATGAGFGFLLLGELRHLGLGFCLGAVAVLFGLDGAGTFSTTGAGSGGAGSRAGRGFGELLAKLVVLLVQAAEFDNDLIQKVVNLVLVIAFAELGRLKALVDNVFWRQSHLVTSYWFVWVMNATCSIHNNGSEYSPCKDIRQLYRIRIYRFGDEH